MKKIIVLIISLFVMIPVSGQAYTYTNNIQYVDLFYSPVADRYFLNYYLTDYADSLLYVNYKLPDGTVYSKTWGPESINKTIRINCNVVSNQYFKLNGVTIGSIENIITNEIEDEVCLAEIPGSTNADINLSGSSGNGTNGAGYGQYRIDYTKLTGGQNYQLQKSTDGGTSWTTVAENDGSNGFFIVNSPGFYRMNVYDGSNQLISRDILGESEFINTTCDGCQLLSDILACPGWDQFLGDFTDALSDAIPTPVDLGQEIGDSIVDKLAEQDVTPDDPVVPEPFDPGYPEQQTDLPAPVTTDINPQPTDFEPVTTGDGSGAFELTDPLNWEPDDSDKAGGYVPPDPDPDTAPDYQEGDTGGDTPPAYDSGDVGDMPDYETTDPGTAPNYNAGGPGDEIPSYNYGG